MASDKLHEESKQSGRQKDEKALLIPELNLNDFNGFIFSLETFCQVMLTMPPDEGIVGPIMIVPPML